LNRRLLTALAAAMLAGLMALATSPVKAEADPDGTAPEFLPGPPPGEWTGPVYPPGISPGTDAQGAFCLARDGECLSKAARSAGADAAVLPTIVGVWANPTNPTKYQDVTFTWSVDPPQGTACSDYFGNRWSNTGGASFPRGVWDQPSQFNYWVYCVGPGGEAAASVTITIQGAQPPPPPPPPPPPTGDQTPPTVPGALRVTDTALGRIVVAWNASTDNVRVAGYGLYRNGASTGTTTATSATFAGLVCGTSYAIGVDAFDAAGNRSARATIQATTAACPPFVDDTVVEEEASEITQWQAGYGQFYLDGLTEPGGDRGTRSKEGCRTAQHTETRKSFVQGVMYRVRLTVSWCWRSVWSSVQKRHVPEVYNHTSSCNQLDVRYGIVIDKSCVFPQTLFFVWNQGPRGKAVTTAEALYKNCFEGIPFIDGCLPWQWHHLLTITAYGNGTWSKS
jgi:hypothetical protein